MSSRSASPALVGAHGVRPHGGDHGSRPTRAQDDKKSGYPGVGGVISAVAEHSL